MFELHEHKNSLYLCRSVICLACSSAGGSLCCSQPHAHARTCTCGVQPHTQMYLPVSLNLKPSSSRSFLAKVKLTSERSFAGRKCSRSSYDLTSSFCSHRYSRCQHFIVLLLAASHSRHNCPHQPATDGEKRSPHSNLHFLKSGLKKSNLTEPSLLT